MQILDLCYPSALRRDSIILAIKSLASHPVKEKLRVSIFSDNLEEPSFSLLESIKNLQKTIPSLKLFDLKKRQKTVDALSKSFDKELLHYALFPPEDGTGWGVNVNASMLYSSGNILISTDDDIISKPKKLSPSFLSQMDTALSLENSESSQKVSDEQLLLYYRTKEALLSSLENSENNLLQSYVDIFSANKKSNEQILWINPGLYGDTGMGSARGTLSLTGFSRSFLLQDYDALKLSGQAINCHTKTLISKKTNLMAGQTAFYNKVPLAPFMPYGRNSDGLSGLLTRLIYPGSRAAYTDFALYHASDGTRNNPAKTLTWVKPSISDLAMIVAIVFRKETEEGFNYYGSLFSDIARLSNSSFVNHLHGAFSAQYTAVIEYYEKLLERYNREPASWAADMEQHIENIQEKMRNSLSLFGKEGCDLSIERAKYHLEHYGELLKIWPDLWKKNLE
jgi:hypothetical protein